MQTNLKVYYVYFHVRSSDGRVFYVGKGKGKRAWSIQGRSDWWFRVKKKHGIEIVIKKEGMSESCAMTLEKVLINTLRKSGNPLVNITDGGQGLSGHTHSKESIELMKELSARKYIYSSLGEEFASTADAARFLMENGHKRASYGSIAAAARGSRDSAYGRAWSYNGIPDHPEFTGRKAIHEAARRKFSKPVI